MVQIKDVTITAEELELLETVISKECDGSSINPLAIKLTDELIGLVLRPETKERLIKERDAEIERINGNKDNLAILRGKILQIKKSFTNQ